MNARTLLASLAATAAVLAGTGVYLIRSRPAFPGATFGTNSGPGNNRRTAEFAASTAPASATAAVPAAAWEWSSVESEDYRKYVANLRAIECPEYTIRDIIIADLNKLFTPKEAPFKDPPAEVTPPTSTKSSAKAADAAARRAAYERRKQLREVEKEKAAVVKELLGYTLPLSPLRGWYSRNYDRYEAALNALPPEKRERVREVQESFWEAHDRLSDAFPNQNPYPKEFEEQYRNANEQRRAAMAAVLGPDELEDYEMRVSGTAARLATQLAGISLTPDQFKAMYRAQAQVEEPYGGSIPRRQFQSADAEEMSQQSLEFDQLVRDTLGDHGFSQYQRAQDSSWQTLKQLRGRFDLSDETIEKAYEMQMRVSYIRGDNEEASKIAQELALQRRQLAQSARNGTPVEPDQLRILEERFQAQQKQTALAHQLAAEQRQAGLQEIANLLGGKAGLVFLARNPDGAMNAAYTPKTLPTETLIRQSSRPTATESSPVIVPNP